MLSLLAWSAGGLRLPPLIPRIARKGSTTVARAASTHPLCPGSDVTKLPGDPSLVLHTNVVMEDKMAFLKSASSLIASALGKCRWSMVVEVD